MLDLFLLDLTEQEVFVFFDDLQVVIRELGKVKLLVKRYADLLNLHEQVQSSLAISSVQSENQELNQAGVFELVQGKVIAKVVLDESQHLTGQVFVLQQDRLRKCG